MTNYISLNTDEAMALHNIKKVINEEVWSYCTGEEVENILNLLKKIDNLVVYED